MNKILNKPKTISEVAKEMVKQKKIFAKNPRIGNWTYQDSNLTLQYNSSENGWYEIDLERCNSSAEILDWIFQVNKKGYSAKDMKDLLDMFEKILRPQKNFCSWGVDNPQEVTRVLIGLWQEK